MKKRLMAIVLTFVMALVCIASVSADNGEVVIYDDEPMTRAIFCAKAVEVFGLSTGDAYGGTYTDLDPSHKYYREMMIMSGNQFLPGFADDKYRPDSVMGKAEVATALAKIKLGNNGAANLPDTGDSWFGKYATYVSNAGLMNKSDDWLANATVGDVIPFRTGRTATFVESGKKPDAVDSTTPGEVTTDNEKDTVQKAEPAQKDEPAQNNGSIYGGDPEIVVILDGQKINFDVKPIIILGRTLVPLRAIFEALNAEVYWDGDTETVTAVRGGITITVKIGENKMTRNGAVIELDAPARIINDRTLVPVRAISEAFDCRVDWEQETQTVLIYTN